MPGKLDKDNTDDILKQFISDDEDQDQLGNNEEKLDDDSATGPVVEEEEDGDPDDTAAKQKEEDEADDLEIKEKLPEDRAGNLVKNGKVVVKAGKDRGIFEKLKRKLNTKEQELTGVYGQLGTIAKSARELMDKYKALSEEKSYGDKLGLEPPEQREALELFAKSKIDPMGALKAILTKAHLAGNDLSSLGVTGPLDPAEVAKHVLQLQEAKKPVVPAATDSVEEPHVKDAREFLDRYPELKVKENSNLLQAVADAKTKFPHLTLDECWIRIKTYIANQKKAAKEAEAQKKPPQRVVPHNSSNVEHVPNRRGLDMQARAPNSSYRDIGAELLADLKALEEK